MAITYYSTNGESPEVSFDEALLNGQAPDRGLYMPGTIPVLPPDRIRSFSSLSYPEIATAVLGDYVSDVVDREQLGEISKEVYDFPVPLERVSENEYIMRLDRGPTASFKDFGARMMGRLMQRVLSEKKQDLLILTATSGDTGSAIANAFYGLDNIDVVILFPEREISLNQRKQMTTLHKNISVLGIDGKFDDCQAMVKRAFSDPRLSGLPLSSANSINIGRLLPQSVYYFYAFSRLVQEGNPIIFSVPSGNFGDMMGAVLAVRMGLPIEKLIIATNSNDEFPRFLETGIYQKVEPSRFCISSAMNVGHPSNLARLVHLYGGRMDENGEVQRKPDMVRMKKDLFAVSIDENRTREMISRVYRDFGILLEPHGAVAWGGLMDYFLHHPPSSDSVYVSIETAHPAKFPDCFSELLNVSPALPPTLGKIQSMEERFERLDGDYESFFTFLDQRFRNNR